MAQSGRIQQVSQLAGSDLGVNPAASGLPGPGGRAVDVRRCCGGRCHQIDRRPGASARRLVIYDDADPSPQDNRLPFGELKTHICSPSPIRFSVPFRKTGAA